MNKNLHRIVFNAARGMRMVVHETARSAGKSTTTASGLGVVLSALLGAASAQGQIIGAPNVPGNQRPMVIAAPNGVPVANIQTPSAAGVSRNVYNRFDVQSNGLILNNSRNNTQTKLGGWVQGNLFLATGPARVILNEVNSGNPSQIRGYIEVAGQRAEVIVANPAGIYVDGAGFINASKATLTTGIPQLNAFGGLDGYRVSGGTVSIDGKGLDLSGTDYAAIYARALQVNAGIWANDLKVVTGANEIGVNDAAITPIAGTGPTPAFALDVALLGGMYSNKITLVGSEAGLGVRNAGNIGAGAGGLIVTAAGRLENTGTLEGSRVDLASASDIDNRGGTIRQTSTAGLTLTAPSLSNTNGGVVGAEPLSSGSDAGRGSAGGGTTGGTASEGGSASSGSTGGSASFGSASTGTSGGGASSPIPVEPVSPGSMTASGAIVNDGGRIFAGGPITLQTPQINNAGGSLSAASMAVTGPAFSNAGGTLNISDRFQANVGQFDNKGGSVNAGSVDIAATGDLLNVGGKIASAGDVALNVGGQLDNTRGSVSAPGALTALVTGAINNTGGNLSGQTARIEATRLDNTQGLVAAGADLSTRVQGPLINQGGQIAAGGSSNINAGALANSGGELTAGGDLDLQVQGAIGNQSGLISANGKATVRGTSLDNTSGQLGTGTDLDLKVDGVLSNRSGAIFANGSADLGAGSLDNNSGRVGTIGGDLRLDIAGHADNSAGSLLAAGQLEIASNGLTNTGGTASGKGIRIDTRGAPLDNQGGKLLSGADLDIASGDLGNAGGQIASDGAIRIASAALDNTSSGRINSAGPLTIDTQRHQLTNDGGQIHAQGSLKLNTGGAAISNTGGLIHGQSDVVIDAGAVNNSATSGNDQGIEAAKTLQLTAASLDNQSGAVRAMGDAAITAAEANNASGLIVSGGTLSLADASGRNMRLDNTGGQIGGVVGVNLGIGESTGSGAGSIASDGNIHLQGAGDWTNKDSVESGGNIRYDFAGTLTNSGTLSAGETLSGSSHDLINSAGASMNGHRVEVDVAGTLTNDGTIEATDTLIAKGTDIVNGSTGLLTSGNHTYLKAAGSLSNQGVIDGEDTQVRGGSITNASRIYGTWLSVGGGASVVNEADAVIAARSFLDLGATNIVNRGELLSEDGMTIAGGLDDDTGVAIGKASVLRNESALISANGNMKLAAADIQNIDAHLTVERVTTGQSTRTIITVAGVVLPEGTEARPAGAPGTPEARYLLVKQADGTWIPMGPGYTIQTIDLTVEEDQARNPKAARIFAGGDIDVDGRLTNRDSQVLAGGNFSANEPVINSPTMGVRHEYGTSSFFMIGINPNGSGDTPVPIITPIDNPPTTHALTNWGGPRGGGSSVNNDVPFGTGGGSGSGGNGPNGPNIGGKGGGSGIIEVPGAVDSGDGSGPRFIRTATPNLGLPTSSLFSLRPSGGYLVETDPRYAGYRNWLGSDYLLDRLGLDPNYLQKRLGDGYYEQRLIREQVAQLTGHRFLDGYTSDEEQFAALMNAGFTFAQKFNLTPGIALTAEQMAQLTSDIVWLVEQTVTLPDGTTQRALVPQVYVRVRPGDIDGSGTLLSADKIRIKGEEGAGDVINRGTIAGRTLVEINADNIRNLDGGRITGGSVQLDARQDIDNIGSTMDARQSLKLNAGRNVNVATTTTTRQSALSEFATAVDRVAGLYVTGPNGSLQVDAGRDINLTGVQIVNRGSANPAGESGLTRLNAGRDLNLDTVTESRSRADALAGGYSASSSSREIGTSISTNGTTILGAGQDINARQADVNAGSGLLLANAGRNLKIVDGQANDSSDYLYQTTKEGRFSNTTTTIAASTESSKSVGSNFQGGLVSLHADNNVKIIGSHISGTQGVGITAGNELNIVEGRDTHSSSAGISRTKSFEFLDRHLSQEKKVSDTLETRTDNAAASSITSAQGGVYLEGGNSVYMRGVQVDAAKDLTIKGGEVTIIAARNEASVTVGNSTSKKSGVSSALHGLDRKNENIRDANTSSLARSTLSGENITITATKENGGSGALTMGGTTIDTPGKLKLEGDSVNLALQSTEASTSHTGGSRNLTWQSTKDSGTADETLHYNRINAGSLEVNANRVTVGMNAKDSVEALAQQPGMAWIGQMNSDPNLAGKVDWQKIEEAHRNWDYGKSGLTPEGAAVVTAIVTWVTWGAASAAGAAASEGVAASGAAAMGEGGFVAAGGLTASGAVGGAVTAGVSALASQAAIALINNQGDIGKTLDDLGSSSSVKNLLTAIVTGGVLGGLQLNPTGLPTTDAGASKVMTQLGKNLTAGAAKAVIGTAINGGSLEDALKEGIINAFLDTAAATGANWIGGIDGVANKIAHAIAGCAIGAARTDGSCAAGALGAVIGELSAELYGRDIDTVQFAAMMSSIAGAVAGGDANQINLASQAGANAAANNYLNHDQWKKLAEELDQCKQRGCSSSDEQKIRAAYQQLSADQDRALRAACSDPSSSACRRILNEATLGTQTQEQLAKDGRLPESYLAGSDFNANVRLVQQKVDAYDIVYTCNSNPSQCDQQRLNGAMQLVMTGVGVAALTAFSVELGVIGAGILAEGAATYCGTRPQQCLNVVTGLAEMGSGTPYSGVSIPSTAKIPAGYTAVEMGGLPPRTIAVADATTGEIRLLTRDGQMIDVPPAPLPPWSSAADNSTVKIVWGKGIEAQGMPWEDHLATVLPPDSRLPPGFKTFDFYDEATGVATSAKTLDTTTSSRISVPTNVYSTVKGYVDEVAGFERAEMKGAPLLEAADITVRQLNIAVPASTTAAQWQQIQMAIEYGQSKNVKVLVTGVR